MYMYGLGFWRVVVYILVLVNGYADPLWHFVDILWAGIALDGNIKVTASMLPNFHSYMRLCELYYGIMLGVVSYRIRSPGFRVLEIRGRDRVVSERSRFG